MSIEDTIREAISAEVAPLRQTIDQLKAEVVQLHRALPAQLVSLHEASKLLGLSLSTVRRRVRDGTLPTRKVGRAIRLDVSALRPLSNEEVAEQAWRLRHATKQQPGKSFTQNPQ